MLSRLDPQRTVLEIRPLVFTYLFSTNAWIVYFGFELKGSQSVFWGNSIQPKVLLFFEKSARQLQGTFSILRESSNAAVLLNHVTCGAGFGMMKSLGFEELSVCKSPVFSYKLTLVLKAHCMMCS